MTHRRVYGHDADPGPCKGSTQLQDCCCCNRRPPRVMVRSIFQHGLQLNMDCQQAPREPIMLLVKVRVCNPNSLLQDPPAAASYAPPVHIPSPDSCGHRNTASTANTALLRNQPPRGVCMGIRHHDRFRNWAELRKRRLQSLQWPKKS